MIYRVKEFLKKYDLQDKTIIIGFSGGYDSMCLLDILSKIKYESEYADMTLVAAHFNHNWRGEEALKEQEICRIFASSRGAEFYTKTASEELKKTENDARIARYEFFEEAYDAYDADAVFTAHNSDDNAETVLYRIVKGTGIVGLCGISEKRQFFYRPLLNISRKEIEEYCNKNNLTPNNDSSNNNIMYKRNFIRHNVFPELSKINENVKDAINTLSEIACSDNLIIEEYLKDIRKKVFAENLKLNSQEYKNLLKPVKMRILHEYIQKLELDYDYKKIQEIYDFLEKNIEHKNGSTKSLATALWLYADEKIVETIPPKGETISEKMEMPVIVSGEGEYIFAGKQLTIKKYEEKELFVFPESTSNFAYVNMNLKNTNLVLRHRKDGDVISPFGMSGSMKLKKYLNSKGVPRHNRDNLILLCSGNEVLWVVGVGLSSKIAVTDKPSHVIEVV